MPTAPDPVRYAAAAARFRAFFDELRAAFVERDDLLRQVALALLAREHVLLMGPPGTAKSQLAGAVFGRIVDEATGQPSLYARQITESTVQTDLVGPLDFKTLMETGRTEHFTDEGMLGAVHAFLDEVFDGRDMLLRTALNVLQERELKQGTRITKGRVECALMTSNRYISDVLETSRERLLAFVDRIAFVGFVPRGFAHREHLGLVLRRYVGGAARPLLQARLTLQDLDVLQDAVEAVYVSEPVCDGLAALLDQLDAELHAAARADPGFVPTRYLSTRTAVRAGRILRAVCVHDHIFGAQGRPFEVLPKDFGELRLHLVLAGPSPEAVELLLERETDAQERRQLTILRTEREIFERCVERMPSIRVVPRPPPKTPAGPARPPGAPGGARSGTPEGAAGDTGADAAGPASAAPAPLPERDPLEERAIDALSSGEPRAIAELARELSPIARSGQPGAERAARLVARALAALQEQAVAASLGQHGAERPLAAELERIVSLAAALEEGGAATLGIARWLRARAVAKIDEMARFSGGAAAADLEAAAGLELPVERRRGGAASGIRAAAPASSRSVPPPATAGERARQRAERRLVDLEGLHALRKRLLAQGADAEERGASRAAWGRALDVAEDDLVALLDASLREAVAGALASDGGALLRSVLAAIRPELDRIEAIDARLAALRDAPAEGGGAEERGGRASLKARVVGPRIGRFVAAALGRLQITDRAALLDEIEALRVALDRARLRDAIPPRDWLSWGAAALLRAEAERGEAPGEPLGYDGYRALRAREQRVPSTYTLAEIALRVAPEVGAAPSPAAAAQALAELTAQIPEAERARVVRLDLARLERAVGFLERWWAALALEGAAAPSDERLRSLVQARFFDVLWDEAALARFAAEATLIAHIFPAHAGEAAALRGRLEALDAATREGALDLVRRRADAAWTETLGRSR